MIEQFTQLCWFKNVGTEKKISLTIFTQYSHKMLKGKIAESFIEGGHQGENENVPVLWIFSLQS